MKPYLTRKPHRAFVTGSFLVVFALLLNLLTAPAWAAPGDIVTIAGGGAGDGGLAVSALVGATRVAADNAGNVYIADNEHHRVRKVDSSGVITTVAGTGVAGNAGDNGPATLARLNYPMGIALDGNGNLFIADTNNNVIRRVDPAGIITTVAGTGMASYSGDGPALAAALNAPADVAVDPSGALIIADRGNYRVRKVAGGMMTTVAGVGWWGSIGDGGPATEAALTFPSGIAVDQAGNVFIADESNHKVRMVDASGIITTVVGTGEPGYNGDGLHRTVTQLQAPRGVAFDPQGRLLVVDSNNNRVRRVDATGIVTTVAGNGEWAFSGDGGPATAAALQQPWGVACDPNGNIIVADTANFRIRSVDFLGNISTFAGNGTLSWTGDGGPASAAAFSSPGSLAMDQAGHMYIADVGNNRIRRIDSYGTVTTFAGTGIAGYGGDGMPAATATFANPTGIALDAAGNLYVADSGNNRIRKIDSAGVVSTVAGNGVGGYNGDGMPAIFSSLDRPVGVTVDALGNIFIAEFDGNRVRKVDTAGIMTTVAGTGLMEYNGDNMPAIAASVARPASVALDSAGNLYIADSYNARIRKVDTSGIITTVAGTGVRGYNGDGMPAVAADLESPVGVRAVNGNLYIIDGNRVRRVNPDGTIATVAGDGTPGFQGDSGPATAAWLLSPRDAWVDAYGGIFIADTGNGRIRLVFPQNEATPITINWGASSTDSLNVTLTLQCTGLPGGCYGAQFSNDAINWTDTVPFEPSRPWTLVPGEGVKTVYVRFTDGFATWSEVYSDTIYLVASGPGVAIVEPAAGAVYGNDPLLSFNVWGPVGPVTVYLDGVQVPKYSGDHLGPLAVGPHLVRVEVRDYSGGNMAFAESVFTVQGAVPFGDDFESGALKWETVNGLWHVAGPGSLYPNSHSGGNSMWYGQELTGNYDVGENSGWIVSTPFTVPNNGSLRFWSWEQVEGSSAQYDTRKVYISVDGGGWVPLYQSLDNSSAWHQVDLDLAQFAGRTARLIFEFRSVDGAANAFRGWYLDDITVSGSAPPPAAIAFEGFESGLLQSPPWTAEGSQPWRVVSDSSHGGLYSARSGAILDSQVSVMETSVDCVAGEMSFWFALESEGNFDFLTVQVDGVERGRWSGSYGWTQATVPVSAGPHVFKWTYVKDGSVSIGRDAAWVDDIVFPTAPAVPVVTITSPVQGARYKEPPILTFGSTAPNTAVYLDGVLTPVQNGMYLPWLADGSHIVRVESSNAAGTAAADVNFFIDATPPVVTITAPLPGAVVGNTPVLVYSANEGGAMTVWVDGVQTEAPSGMPLKYLADGSHTVRVQEIDPAGNIGFAEVAFIVSGTSGITSFSDDMESGGDKWESAGGLWHLVNGQTSTNGNSHSGSTSWWYGQESTGNYDVGITSGALVSKPFTVGTGASLKFWSWEQTEGNTSYDTRKVFLSTDGGATWSLLVQLTDATSSWHQVVTSLAPYAGMTVKLKFEFNSVDGVGNAYRGWYLDDVTVAGAGGGAPTAAGDAFETGDFSSLPWVFSGNAPWTVTTGNAHGGQFAAKAGTILDGQSSTMQTTVDCAAGAMSFWFAVSSEYNWDFLRFYVDGVEQVGWSGNVGWTQLVTVVTEGVHTFKWVYVKDSSVSAGSDTAWIDDIVFPTKAVPTVNLGSPVQGESYKQEPILSYSVSEGSAVVKLDGVVINAPSGSILPPLADGVHAVRVEASNAAGTGYAEANFVMDRVAPLVTITSPSPGKTDKSQPLLAYSASEGTPVVKLDGVVVSVPSGSALPQLADGLHTVRVEAADAAGNLGFAEVSFTVDTVQFAISIDPLPSPSNSNSFVLTGTRDSRATMFGVGSSSSVNFGTLTFPTNSTWRLPVSGLPDGSTTFNVSEEDGAGHAAAVSLTIVIDTVAPVVTIAYPAAGISANRTPVLTYTVSEGAPVVQVDGVVVSKISGDTLGPLSDGPHTVRVQVADAAGNIGFALVNFSVDTTAPVVNITSPGTVLGNNRTPVLTYSLSEGNAVVRVDGVVVAKVSGDTLGPLADGEHTVRVEATDAAGNTGFAQVSFSVDATAPVVTITSPGTALGNNRTPVLTYSVSEGNAVVWLDGAVVVKASGDTLGPLADGTHTVKVVATDAAGNSSFAEATFSVDATAPVVTITSPGTALGNNRTPVLTYSVSEGNAVVWLDGAVVVKASGETLGPLADGTHTVKVVATDAAGNSSFAEVTFSVDATAPVVTVTSPASGTTLDRTPLLLYTVGDGSVVVKVDGNAVNKTSGSSLDALGNGNHMVTVEATDAAGNTAISSVNFTVAYTPLAVGTASLPFGTIGTPYNRTLSATGGVPGYTWSVASGNLPDGLTLNGSTGVISGVPGVAGSFAFTVRVADNDGASATASFSVSVYPPLQIGTTSLAGGYAGASYSQSLTASGGTGSYTWSVISGSLPEGLSLNPTTGQIAGTPTAAGSSFTVECRDGNQTAATAALAIVIEAARPDLVVTAVSGPTSGTRGKKVMLTATVKNQGQATAGASTLSFYLSSDGTVSGADTKVADVSVGSLAAGGSQTVSFNATVPATLPAGSYVIGAIADRVGVVAETDEANNAKGGGSIDIR
ncbi:putative Ig domain-containing protein [Geomonas nitrogeniifigens]|uniref:Ig domain-containing protein n=1 Tax=Geomonas diazotrophica TaxID=2843197 RepID=A0ABX8JKI0_9BACT|nr:putative Ig domain-containing protein [Geomonas nitrogeniifigens]QWV97167.1 putative Ig domain-containing protein [Geomonas nitrogeniifigens]